LDDLWSYVAYDMDEEDEKWLTEYNSKFSNSSENSNYNDGNNNSTTGNNESSSGDDQEAKKVNPKKLTEDGFELVVDRLEKFAFRCDRNAESTMKQMAVDQSDDVCAVCGDGMSEDANQIIYCDGCDLAVHQQCYGVPYIPEGSWKCERCLSDTPAECVLCHDRTRHQALRRTTTGEWVHVLCALWAPHTRLSFIQGPGEIEYLDSIDISRITQGDRQTVCYICNTPGGVCTHCCQPGCSKGFHATCGRAAKLHMRCSIPEIVKENALFDKEKCRMMPAPPAPCSFGKYRSWCAEHKPIGRPPGRRKSAVLSTSNGSGDEEDNASHEQKDDVVIDSEKPSVTEKPVIQEAQPVEPAQPDKGVKHEKKSKKEKKQKKSEKQMTLLDLPGVFITSDKKTDSSDKSNNDGVDCAPKETSTTTEKTAPEGEPAEKNIPYAGVKLSRVYAMTHGVDKDAVDAVHDYWVSKRRKRGDVPLLKQFDPTVIMLNRPVVKHHPKHTNDKLGLKKLYRLRYDFERTRNILEIVRQREALKLSQVKDEEMFFDLSNRTELQRNLMSALRSLQQLDRQGFFCQPVTVIEAPDYFDVIRYPMDFSVMEKKIDGSLYHDWESFARDFYQVCANAVTYNAPETVFSKAAHSLYQRGLTVLVRKFGAVAVRSLLPADVQPITRRNSSFHVPEYPPPLELTMFSDEEGEEDSDNESDHDNDGPRLRGTRSSRTPLQQRESPFDILETIRKSPKRPKKKTTSSTTTTTAGGQQGVKRPRGRPRKYPIVLPQEETNKLKDEITSNEQQQQQQKEEQVESAKETATKKTEDKEVVSTVQPPPKKRKTERIKPIHYVIYEDVDLEAERAEAERQKERKRKITGCLKELGVAPDEVDTEAPRSMRSRHRSEPEQPVTSTAATEDSTMPKRRRNCPPKRFYDE